MEILSMIMEFYLSLMNQLSILLDSSNIAGRREWFLSLFQLRFGEYRQGQGLVQKIISSQLTFKYLDDSVFSLLKDLDRAGSAWLQAFFKIAFSYLSCSKYDRDLICEQVMISTIFLMI